MTHGIWTSEELTRIEQGKDSNLITDFLNEHTFSKNEIKLYPYHLRRTFVCQWLESEQEEFEPVTIYATDKKHLNNTYSITIPVYRIQLGKS